jgi:hypothetical protein
MMPQAADDPMTLRSAAVGDAAAAMKGGLSLVNAGEARCGRARTRVQADGLGVGAEDPFFIPPRQGER